jgi:hypothetical protein
MDVEIRISQVEGLGVFARSCIEAEEWQYVYGDELIDPLPQQLKYCFENDDTYFMPYEPFKFLNHSDTPNCKVFIDEWGTMHIEALQEIFEGEELTIDYGYLPVCDATE